MYDEFQFSMNRLARDIAGEISLSEDPEKIMKKWRGIFGFSQKDLASHMGITSSVISDYESGRRKSPGIGFIRRYTSSLLHLDMKRGGMVIKTFSKSKESPELSKAIIDIKEFSKGMPISEFCKKISAPVLTKKSLTGRNIYGYTIIDSVKAIMQLSYNQLISLYGTTTQRALLFTGVSTGKTPMVAIKLTNLQPGLVVLHGLNRVDEVAMNIAKVENIPLALCNLSSTEDIMDRLGRME